MAKSKPQLLYFSKIYLFTISSSLSGIVFSAADDAPDRPRIVNTEAPDAPAKKEISELRAAVNELSALVDQRLAADIQPDRRIQQIERENRQLETELKLALEQLEKRERDLNEYSVLTRDLAAELENLEFSLDSRVAVLSRERDELTATLASEREVFEEMRTRWNREREEMTRLKGLLESQEALLRKQDVLVSDGAKLLDQTRAQLVEENVLRQNLEHQCHGLRQQKELLVTELDLLRNPPSISPVFFTRNAAQADAENARVLAEAEAILERAPRATFHIVGHTCDLGSEEDNLTLSKFRARLLADYLGENGVPGEKISFAGQGETEPAVANNSEESRAKNRRTEILVVLPAQ
ncbi:MAG: OmpA family protein [Verrucomicrobiota bacterium]